ncbi:MAG TPA: Smr/MutS family protein, partial [Candidatus Caccousia avicola]|nr:Smr/MutS family protein [Candidatus Caccousia avicola]
SMLNEVEELRKKQNKLLTAEQKAKLKSGMKRLEEEADPIRRRRQEEGEYILPRPLRAGDTVLIYDINKKASVLEVPPDGKGPVLVQAGIIRMRVPQENLRLSEPEKEKKDPRARSRNVTKQLSSAGRGAMEIDLRGQMVEEGILNVDRFLDSASMAGVHQVTIIHGKGTGRLRAAVQAHLRHHPMVKSFRLGAYGEGEAGVTVVELK